MRRSMCLMSALLLVLALAGQARAQISVEARLDPVSAGESSVTLNAPDEAAVGGTIAIYSAIAGKDEHGVAIAPVCDAKATSMPLEPDTSNLLLAGYKTTVHLKDPAAEGQTLCAFVTAPKAPAAAAQAGTLSSAAAIAAAATDAATRAAIAAVAAAKPEDAAETARIASEIAAAVASAAVRAAIADSAREAAPAPAPGPAPKVVPAPAGHQPEKGKKPVPAVGTSAVPVTKPATPPATDRETAELGPMPVAEVVVRPAFAKTEVVARSRDVSYETSSLAAPAEESKKPVVTVPPVTEEVVKNAPKAAVVSSQTAPPGFDWGLVRAYFTLGALASQERDQFSHQDLFLSFRLDKAYTGIKVNSETGGYSHHPTLNSFFETRLTAIPVAVQNCTPAAATKTTPAVTCANQSSGTGAATDGTTSQAFLNSQKSARLEFGVYAPILLKSWSVASQKNASTPYALFIAPLVKTGFDTTLNGLNQTQQNAGTAGTVQGIGGSNEFYKFYDFGFRLGHYKLPPVTSVGSMAPDTLSFLDVSFGRFSNLASLLCPTASYTGNNTCSAQAGTLAYARDARLNVEGLLEVPATKGFSIGFSTNVAFDPFRRQGSATLHHIRPADDLRFLFAYKFDISSVAAKLAPGFKSEGK